MRKFLCLTAVFAIIAGCENQPTAPRSVECNSLLLDLSATTGDTIPVTSSVRYIEILTGNGAASDIGVISEVNYSLYVEVDGEMTGLDSSCPATNPTIRYRAFDPNLLQGFQSGILGMREGGVRRVILDPDAGYTNPNHQLFGRTLVFDVELVQVD